MKSMKITTDYVTLGQALKFFDIISNGGEAKYYLANHTVFVNDQSENRRGRKLYPGDNITVNKQSYLISKWK